MKKLFACLLALCMIVSLFAACGSSAPAEAAPAESVQSAAEAPAAEPEPEEAPAAPEASVAAEPSAVEEASVVEEPSAQEPEEPAEPQVVTITIEDALGNSQSFEATVGEEFVFFFQCDAPGDMGEPAEGEEGAGITASEGEITYSNVGLGGPFQYPTSEKVTLTGFTGDVTLTVCEAATYMEATYTIYTTPEDIQAAIEFAEMMAAQQAANPMP